MKYDFDTPIERRHTDSASVELMRINTGRDDLIPLWIADMDFPTPPFIMNAIQERMKQKIMGYTCPSMAYFDSIKQWNKRRHGIDVPMKCVHFIPGIVPGICFAVNCFTEKGDRIMINTPVYHPFGHVIESCSRVKVEVPLKIVKGRFQMDFDAIERELPKCKMLIFCNPHNPGGTSWHAEEISRLIELCSKYGVLVISDEIHADMTFAPAKHVPTVAACDDAKDITITFMAPTKAFNLPGIISSYAVVYNETLRRRFYSYLDGNDIANGNVFSYDCVRACYSDEGEDWLRQMLSYVSGNIDYVESFLARHCSKIKPMRPEASFLVFLDNRELNFSSQKELCDFYANDAGLYLNDGEVFGAPGRGFMRLNVGQPRCIIEKAMNCLAKAYSRKF